MKNRAVRIVPMGRSHIGACTEIVRTAEPWKSLREGIGFALFISLKQAYVYVAGAKTAGFVVFTPEAVFARGGYLRAIGVAPHMRGQGIRGKTDGVCGKGNSAPNAEFISLCIFVQPSGAGLLQQTRLHAGREDPGADNSRSG